MSKEAFFILNDELVKDNKGQPITISVFDGQKLFRIHFATKKLEEIELQYDKNAVMFDAEWHYVAALGPLKAIKKFEKYESDIQSPPSEADKKD